MELALTTGWTPEAIDGLPASFRRACHWRLWVRALVGDEGFPPTQAPPGSDAQTRLAYGKQAFEVDRVRKAIFPEGD